MKSTYEKITYRVGVPITYRWATGTMRGTGVRYVEVEEDRTYMGGLRAIDKAIEQVGEDRYHSDISPTIEPPAGQDWEVGT